MATGLSNGNYELGGQPVHVKGRQAVSFGIPLESATNAAGVNSAKFIGKILQYKKYYKRKICKYCSVK